MQAFSMTFRAVILGLVVAVWVAQNDGIAAEPGFSYEEYGKLLKTFVDNGGMVDYRGLKMNPKALDDFTSSVSDLDPKVYYGWTDKKKIAFWINVYNAFTLKAIIDHYPIRPSFLKSFVYPENSIRQIPGVWDRLKFRVMGRDMTLDGIEHGMLRAKFHEPRIHMALVCAARGCPPLRNEPYVSATLDEQLDDQARHFSADPHKFRVDRKAHTVYLSSIFSWFGDDFIEKYGTDTRFPGYSQKERAVLNFVSRYLDARDKDFLAHGGYSLTYLPYDWSLNEKQE
jgi:hypothetical protein